MEKFKAWEQFRQLAELFCFFFFKGLSLKYVNWGKNTTVRSMQNKILFRVVLFSVQLRSCFSHLLISVFYNLDGNYSSPTGCYEHLGTEKTGRNPGGHYPLLKKKRENNSKKPTHPQQKTKKSPNQPTTCYFFKCLWNCDVPQHWFTRKDHFLRIK